MKIGGLARGIAASVMVLLAACSGGSSTSSSGGDTTPITPPSSFLKVDPSTPIRQAITDFDADEDLDWSEVSEDADGVKIVRTKLEIYFYPSVTAGDILRVLTNVQATPTSAVGGTTSIVVRVQDPGTLAALDALIAKIQSDSAVWAVERAMLPEPNDIPQEYSKSIPSWDKIDHHLAVRAPGAWNARAAISRFGPPVPPRVVVMDYFNNYYSSGAPNADLSAMFVPADFGGPTLKWGPPSPVAEHGYHVLGIIAGTFGGTGDRGLVTGMMPSTIDLRVEDLLRKDPLDAATRLFNLVKQTQGNVVINTSLGLGCKKDFPQTKVCQDPANIKLWAGNWATKVKDAGLENRILHVTTAGNTPSTDVAGLYSATSNSIYAAAALRTDLTDTLGNAISLNNTLVVGDVANTTGVDANNNPTPFTAQCLSERSFVGGNLGAIGTDVWSFTDPSSSAGNKSGTSMAAPQVAGLAAYMWGLKPTLTVQQLKNILITTARPVPVSADRGCSTHNVPGKIIDAYAAVLALDESTNNPSLAPIRRAILDLNNDGHFNVTDLTTWMTELNVSTPPTSPVYSRYDLNGDGYTGGPRTAAFDLDITINPVAVLLPNPPAPFSQVPKTIGGRPVTFNESNLTDFQILCYYAYSPLYEGDLETFSDRVSLEANCHKPKIVFSDGRTIYLIDPDGSNLMSITNPSGTNGHDISPVWSPDGQRIAFVHWETSTLDSKIYVMNADGSNSVRLTNNSEEEAGAKWSPDGTRIVFTRFFNSTSSSRTSEIFTINADGSNQVNLTNDNLANTPAMDFSAQWAPDGRRIAFLSNREYRDPITGISSFGTFKLWVMNADGTGAVNVSGNLSSQYAFDWSPDGTRIASGFMNSASFDLYTINLSSLGITSLGFHFGGPVWSPDGTKIATVGGIINDSGSLLVQFSFLPQNLPVWSPDGKKLIIIDSLGYIYVVNSDGASLRQLTGVRVSGATSAPQWRP